MKKADVIKLIAFILFIEFIGSVGAIFTTPAIPTWYANLAKPDFNPPSWVFAPVWTSLFLLMGVSLFLVFQKGLNNRSVQIAILLFSIQMALNVLWSAFFFGARSPFLGLLDIILLWLAIVATIFYFFKVHRLASLLLLPYFAWVSFATVLNYYILILN